MFDNKLKKYEFDGWTVRWIWNRLNGPVLKRCSQQLNIQVETNNQWCPLRFILGPTLFNTFIKDIDSGIKCTIRKCVDITKMRIALDVLEGRDAMQEDFKRLRKWTSGNLKKINKAKCKVLYLHWKKSSILQTRDE